MNEYEIKVETVAGTSSYTICASSLHVALSRVGKKLERGNMHIVNIRVLNWRRHVCTFTPSMFGLPGNECENVSTRAVNGKVVERIHWLSCKACGRRQEGEVEKVEA